MYPRRQLMAPPETARRGPAGTVLARPRLLTRWRRNRGSSRVLLLGAAVVVVAAAAAIFMPECGRAPSQHTPCPVCLTAAQLIPNTLQLLAQQQQRSLRATAHQRRNRSGAPPLPMPQQLPVIGLLRSRRGRCGLPPPRLQTAPTQPASPSISRSAPHWCCSWHPRWACLARPPWLRSCSSPGSPRRPTYRRWVGPSRCTVRVQPFEACCLPR